MEFFYFNRIFLNKNEKYAFYVHTSYEKMLWFKLLDLYVVNNFVS